MPCLGQGRPSWTSHLHGDRWGRGLWEGLRQVCVERVPAPASHLCSQRPGPPDLSVRGWPSHIRVGKETFLPRGSTGGRVTRGRGPGPPVRTSTLHPGSSSYFTSFYLVTLHPPPFRDREALGTTKTQSPDGCAGNCPWHTSRLSMSRTGPCG